MRFLITGIGGFAGSHLADYLLSLAQTAAEIWGCDLTGRRRPYHSEQFKLLAVDLRDPAAAQRLIEQVRPDRIYHLAGQAFVGDSWDRPWNVIEDNMRAQLNLLEAVVKARLQPRILVVGSAEEYGRMPPEGLPIKETAPLRPDSPYSVSKIGQDMLGLQYHLSYDLPVVRVRPFNHIGPRQSRRFVAPAFASQIAAIEAGRPPVIRVGNLSARRDFTDVRDVARAYYLALEQGEPGAVYNIGTGRSWRIQDLLDKLLSFAAVAITTEVDLARFRPADSPDLVCDASLFRSQTGWEPEISLDQTLRDLLDYERAQLTGESARTA